MNSLLKLEQQLSPREAQVFDENWLAAVVVMEEAGYIMDYEASQIMRTIALGVFLRGIQVARELIR